MNPRVLLPALITVGFLFSNPASAAPTRESSEPNSIPPSTPSAVSVQSATLQGHLDETSAHLTLSAQLLPDFHQRPPGLWTAQFQHRLTVTANHLDHQFRIETQVLQGTTRDLAFPLSGEGTVRDVRGDHLEFWSIQRHQDGSQSLILRLTQPLSPTTNSVFTAHAQTPRPISPIGSMGPMSPIHPLTLHTPNPTLGSGSILIECPPEWSVTTVQPHGLVPLDPDTLPPFLQPSQPDPNLALAFRFLGSTYSLPLRLQAAAPEAGQVVLSAFQLEGDLHAHHAGFSLRAQARVTHPRGSQVTLLSGDVALSSPVDREGWRLEQVGPSWVAHFDRPGTYSIHLPFHATVHRSNDWHHATFQVATGTLSPLTLLGLPPETQIRLLDGAQPERRDHAFVTHLPAHGRVALAWRPARPETEARLFYAADAITQVTVSPGLWRQRTHFDVQILQGSLDHLEVLLQGRGDLTRVHGPQVLSWSVQPSDLDQQRRLSIRFNQPQRTSTTVELELQDSLGAFPLTFDLRQPVPQQATRFGGHLRLVNEGAVRLETLVTTGLSQVSPEQFIPSPAIQDWLPTATTQVFAYRFSGTEAHLRVQADNILPELGVSQILIYHLGETDLHLDAEFEIDVREAPLRELELRVPSGFRLSHLDVAGLADHFLSSTDGDPEARLRLVFSQPVLGRVLVPLRLERRRPENLPQWELPGIFVERARSVRGHVGVTVDPGFRVTPALTRGLTEMATAYFPRRLPQLQTAFRIQDPTWQATLDIERIPADVQAEVLHLFTIAEGMAYGSSLVQYLITGAPISILHLELSPEYFNVEFTGREVRNWRTTTNGYELTLQRPVVGPYTLLVTYERPFQAQGDTLAFTGARPLDARVEQGHTLLVSTHQFQVNPRIVAGALLPVEPAEVPAEHRLFFDAPILAAYRYTSRPFDLQLALAPLPQVAALPQVIDRALLVTRISPEGQSVTEGRYFVKSHGTPHLRLSLPPQTDLWSATVAGNTVVPVTDSLGLLLPLPRTADPDEVTQVVIQTASPATHPQRLTLRTPTVAAPILLTEWHIEPAPGRHLVFVKGTVTPSPPTPITSGFAAISRLWHSPDRLWVLLQAAVIVASLLIASLLWSGRLSGPSRRGWTHPLVGLLGLAALAVATVAASHLLQRDQVLQPTPEAQLRMVIPLSAAHTTHQAEVRHLQDTRFPGFSTLSLLLGLAAVGVAGITRKLRPAPPMHHALTPIGYATAWCLLFAAALAHPSGLVPAALVFAAWSLVMLLLPSLRRGWHSAPPPTPTPTPPPQPGTATALLIGAVLFLGTLHPTPIHAATAQPTQEPQAESVLHVIHVENDVAHGQATLRWQARIGEVLPVFNESGVLIESHLSPGTARLIPMMRDGRRLQALVAETNGWIEARLTYQTPITLRSPQTGFTLPVLPGLVHRAHVTLPSPEVEPASPHAVAIIPDHAVPTPEAASTPAPAHRSFTYILKPLENPWIAWQPRTRDTRREPAVFYADWTHTFVPSAGLVEGWHRLHIRPAQGQLAALTVEVPPGMTLTDAAAAELASWRFDPQNHRLQLELTAPVALPFAISLRSQYANAGLPLRQSLALPSLTGAADQIGLVGLATSPDVQLSEVNPDQCSPINLEDFPTDALRPAQSLHPDLTLRRSFRHGQSPATLAIAVEAVEPDIRVTSRQTVSLGDDRLTLVATLDVEVARAGIFRLSFPLPPGLDLETASSPALSHWTEWGSGTNRVVTLHLKGRTQGQNRFNLTFSGPGIPPGSGWSVPRLSLREASKQTGELWLTPEQGLRLQIARREGVSPLDPAQQTLPTRGTLAFRLLQEPWLLELDIERVDPWIQVASLQQAAISDTHTRVTANFQYDIEHAGIRTLRLRLPAQAEAVRLRGEQVADFLPEPDAPVVDGRRIWSVRFDQRRLGRCLVQLSYAVPVPEGSTALQLDGVEALDVNLQRGFVTLEAAPRLQVTPEPNPSLQPADSQLIPRALLLDLPPSHPSHTYRLIQPAFRLSLQRVQRDVARLLPARVLEVTFSTLVSDQAFTLTHARLVLEPGDKRQLQVKLPGNSQFWCASVNDHAVTPWQSDPALLIPLEPGSRSSQQAIVEFYFASPIPRAHPRRLHLNLLAPRLDLPLENITWTVQVDDTWTLQDWDGSLELHPHPDLQPETPLNPEAYLHQESQRRQDRSIEAGASLTLARQLLQEGSTQQARRALQTAFGLSRHDLAFNEDARVQLNNLKVQQALDGLQRQQGRLTGDHALPATQADPSSPRSSPAPQADQAVLLGLAQRLIQQQDAAAMASVAIRPNPPAAERTYTFTRPLEIQASRELSLDLTLTRPGTGSWIVRIGLLLALLVVLLLVNSMARYRS